MQTEVDVQEITQEQEQKPVETPESKPGSKQAKPKQQIPVSFALNRAQRRAKGRADRVKAMKERRHAMKHDPVVLNREERKKQRLCPQCGLNFLSGLWRCQCPAPKPTKPSRSVAAHGTD